MSNSIKPWLPTIATVLMLPVLIYLGIWQLDRAQQKQVLQNDYTARSLATPIDVNTLQNTHTDLRFYPAQLTGHFDNTHQFLLDNKFHQHQVGYQVLTPFILKNSNKVVLLNRGWIPAQSQRNILPTIPTVTAELTVTGIITMPDPKSFALSQQTENNTWPQRLQIIDLTQISAITHYKLLPFIILLAPKDSHGFVREWTPFNGKVTTHYGYAFQWFALAVTLLIIFIGVNMRKKLHGHN